MTRPREARGGTRRAWPLVALLAAMLATSACRGDPRPEAVRPHTLGVDPRLHRVGVNAIPPHDFARATELLPFRWYKNFSNFGGPQSVGGRAIDYVPVLGYQREGDTPEFLEQFGQWIDQGLVPMVEGLTKDDYLDNLSLERLRERISTREDLYPPGTLFQVGNEPGYTGHHDDRREPEQIVGDARVLREMLDGLDRGHRLALGGISTPRHDFVRRAYRGRHGLEFWEEILRLAEPDLFDAFVIHPYPSDIHAPSGADLRAQILEARRLLARYGLREKDLIAGETGPIPVTDLDEQAAVRYAREAVEFYLTARDAELGHPGDDHMLVQRFCWFILDGGTVPPRDDRLDMRKSSLLAPDGSLTLLGEAFRDTVERVLAD